MTNLLRLPHVRSHGETEGFWDLYRKTGELRQGGNAVPDVHLVALMRQQGVKILYTRDRGFRRFDGIQVRDLPEPESAATRSGPAPGAGGS